MKKIVMRVVIVDGEEDPIYFTDAAAAQACAKHSNKADGKPSRPTALVETMHYELYESFGEWLNAKAARDKQRALVSLRAKTSPEEWDVIEALVNNQRSSEDG